MRFRESDEEKSHTDLMYQQIHSPDIVTPRGTIQNHMCSILRLMFNDVQNTSQISGAFF